LIKEIKIVKEKLYKSEHVLGIKEARIAELVKERNELQSLHKQA
jgi:hypothetical protein